MINENCKSCVHAEVCRWSWLDSNTQNTCDYYDFEGDWIKADVLQEIKDEMMKYREKYIDGTPVLGSKLDIVAEIIDRKIKELSE